MNTVEESSLSRGLIKSKKRVADHGEVFTPSWLVDAMLDLTEEADRVESRFLEPACGNGNFLIRILQRKLATVELKRRKANHDVEHFVLIAIMSIYGIELLEDNIIECRKRLLRVFADFLKIESSHALYRAASIVLSLNIIHGDALKMLTHDGRPIVFNNIKTHLNKLFGGDMQFDVIIGNPPYQLGQSGGNAVGNFAMPIYQKFIDAAKELKPRYIIMITPSRWFAGGRGLDSFRQEMLSDRRLRYLIDYQDSREVFAGVDIAGGVSYFLWDSNWKGKCEITNISGDAASPTLNRYLNDYDILVRYNEAIPILERVIKASGGDAFESLASQVSPIQPFSIRTSFRGAPSSEGVADPVLIYQKGGTGFIDRDAIPRNTDWVDQWKVFLSRAASEHGGQPAKSGTKRVFSRIIVGGPGTVCTETYLVVGRFKKKSEAINLCSYLRTRFVRFLVSLRTNTQDLYNGRFAFVPNLPMTREWTDEALYKRYSITKNEITFIEKTIRPMDKDDE